MISKLRILFQCILAFIFTTLIFCYATGGDFSWVTLTGPLTLEPNFTALEGHGYVASPALQAVIVRLFFLVLCCFFCMIPNFAGGLRKFWPCLSAVFVSVYSIFSYCSGNFIFFLETSPGASTVRILSLICAGLFILFCYDAGKGGFKFPAPLSEPGFLLSLAGFFFIICVINSLLFQKLSWLGKAHPYFVLLRVGVLATAVTAALAFTSWKKDS